MFRFLITDLRRNITKTLCLTLGMATGLLLVAKIYFEKSYDTSYPAADRIHLVTESVTIDGEYREYNNTPGAIAPGLKRYSPLVESATRNRPLLGRSIIKTQDGREFEIPAACMADSSHFDVFPAQILAGNPHDALNVAGQCMIPRSLAEKIGPDAMGSTIFFPDYSLEYPVLIGGVYEDYPLNSSIGNQVYLSLSTLPLIFSFDGRDNWVGNDGYQSFIKLVPGADPDDLKPAIRKMLEDNVDNESLEVFHFNIGTRPLRGKHASDEGVKMMIWVMSLLAAILLLSSSFNYLLIVIGQVAKREKEMAVRKCFGTGNAKLLGMIAGESLFFLVVSVLLALLIAGVFSNQCRDILGYSAEELLSTGKVWLVESGVCIIVFIITGVIPAWIYCRTPVARAFRRNPRGRRGWKLALLSAQFTATAFLLCLLVLVGRQYRLMASADMGFDYRDVATASLSGVPQNARERIVSELRSLGVVKSVASAEHDFISRASGNNVWLGEDNSNQVNVADMYWANPEIFDVMGMEFRQGEGFGEWADSLSHNVVVEERFVGVLQNNFGEKDSDIVGKRFNITEHLGLDGSMEFTVSGVVKDMRRGGFGRVDADTRAGVLFPSSKIQNNLYVRFHELTPESIEKARNLISSVYPDKDIFLVPMKTRVDVLNQEVKKFGESVMIAGVVILLISLIGLTGYTTDEVQRRAREIAVRKVNGSSVSQILTLLCLDISKVAVPSLLAGGAAALIVGRRWLMQFTDQASLSPGWMLLCIVLIFSLLLMAVVLKSMKVAKANPVEYLRSE